MVLLLLFLSTPIFAQYEIQCDYLVDPTLTIGYVDSCAAFWENSWDAGGSRGGFFSMVNKDGSVQNTTKYMITQSRNAYGYVRAYQMTGNSAYLERAHEALLWMVNHAWDETNGGWYRELTYLGEPQNTTENRTAFYQHYALLGIAAYVEATQDSLMWEWLIKGYQHLEDHFWDDREGYEGYYNYTNYTGGSPQNKSFNATVDAVTTHLLLLERMTGDPVYRNKLLEVGDQMVSHLVGSMDGCVIGFPEEYDSNWNVNEDDTMTLMGHVLKTGWCLARIGQVTGETSWVDEAEVAVLDVLENGGYDHENGGPYKDFDWEDGSEYIWDSQYGAGVKAWWQMEQAITAGLQLYHLTGDDAYLEVADETLDFFMRYFVDHDYGEVYADRTREGAIAWNENKGSDGKAGYHSIETGYYTYLYGSLMVNDEPVSLHYQIAAADTARTLRMMPIAMDSASVAIQSITLNGSEFSNYDAYGQTMTLLAGVGGDLVVTYAPTGQVGISERTIAVLPTRARLNPAFPNPFNASTTLSYSLPKNERVSVILYDITGRKVATLAQGIQSVGEHRISLDGSGLASGVYLVRLSTTSESTTRRVVLVK